MRWYVFRFVILFALVYSAIFGLWFFWIPLVAVSVWLHGFTMPVVVAALVDGYFGAWTFVPLLTVLAIAIGLCVISVKPYVYTIRNI